MVNTGKPSRGCYMCRARRIKCDEAKPSCMRCQKSKRVCPGYRDAFELKLRDESKSTKKKLARRMNQAQSSGDENTQLAIVPSDSYIDPALYYPSAIPSKTSRLGHSRNSSLSSTHSFQRCPSGGDGVGSDHAQHVHLSAHMSTPLHQQAACYFLANFVLVPETGTMRGYLDFVLPLMQKSCPTPTLIMAFSAVAFAALGTRPNSRALLPKADMYYVKALKEINTALKDPRMASTDSTLASTMLLASFEQMLPSRMTDGGWASHLHGAVAVIKSRSESQLKTNVGRDLFIAVRSHMTMHCIAHSKPVDTSVDWMKVVSSGDPIVEGFAGANLKMAALRADNDVTTTLKVHSAENIEKVLKLLRRAEALDQEYIDWVKALPASWEVKTVAFIDGDVPDLTTSLVFPGRVLAYGELWMAYKYNTVRACRIFIWTTILRCIAWLGDSGDYRLTPEYETASRVCRQLIEDIIASVPYFFGWNRDKDANMADRSNFACGSETNLAIKGLSGIFIMWPIFAAIASDFASPMQKIYLRARLKYIAEIMGINQAMILLQAQLTHPSLYITREKLNLPPKSCGNNAIVPDSPQAAMSNISISTKRTESTSPPPLSQPLTPTEPAWISPLPSAIPSQAWSSPEQAFSFLQESGWNSSPQTSASSSQAWGSPSHSITTTDPTQIWTTQPHNPLTIWDSSPQEAAAWFSNSNSNINVNMNNAWGVPLEELQPNWIPRTFTDPDFMIDQERLDSRSASHSAERKFEKGFGSLNFTSST